VRAAEGVRVAILATDLFEESELVEPKKALEEAGASALVIAPKAGMILTTSHPLLSTTLIIGSQKERSN
jgi:putative intracellular protease/amidase